MLDDKPKVIPPCVVAGIRCMFPDKDGVYCQSASGLRRRVEGGEALRVAKVVAGAQRLAVKASLASHEAALEAHLAVRISDLAARWSGDHEPIVPMPCSPGGHHWYNEVAFEE